MERPLRKIMLVEDDPDIQLITRLSLEVGGGFSVEVCGSGPEALRRAPACLPDLLLLDVMMPGMDGLATMDALRKQPELAHTPVIFFTANTQESMRQELMRHGALDILIKPIEPSALVDQIRDIWRRAAPT